MTTLHLDTADKANIKFKLNDEEFLVSGDLLTQLDKALKERNLSLGSITKITVNKGPGSFTSLRIGVSVANTLNYLLNLRDSEDLDCPNYGREPNITSPKSIH